MMLNLGVIDQLYTQPGKKSVSTGDVAGWLENKYHVIEVFYEENINSIQDAITQSLRGATVNIILGSKPPQNPLAAAEAKITANFKAALSLRAFDSIMPGVPTKAALAGKSLRFKRKRGPPRPSFIDTGLYQASFKAWIETK